MTDNTAGGEALILGAGFSRAVSAELPLTDQLGMDSLKSSGLSKVPGVPAGPFTGGSFEAWLSQIAESQPYLDSVANATNQAWFIAIRNAIHERLTLASQSALLGDWPAWLPALLRNLHQERASVVTFNYDTLIECGVASGLIRLPTASYPRLVTVESVTQDLPPRPYIPSTGLSLGDSESTPSFRLLKLHGSLNWYWVDGDATGLSLLSGPIGGIYGRPEAADNDFIRRRLPGREPFIVPPASTKSSYFVNPIVRQLWQDAFDAMESAHRVTFVGYSLPLEDRTFAGLLERACGDRVDLVIEIADPNYDAVAHSLSKIGLGDKVGQTYDSVQDLVSSRTNEMSRKAYIEIADAVTQVDEGEGIDLGECRLLVEFDTAISATVESFELRGDLVILRCSAAEACSSIALQQRHTHSGQRVVNGHDLHRMMSGASRIAAETDGQQHMVIEYEVDGVAGGPYGPWMTFGTATTPRRRAVR